MSISAYLKEIARGAQGARALDRAQASDLLGQVLDGRCTDLEIGAFCVAMRIKGETPGELAGFLDALHTRLHLTACINHRPVVVLPAGTLCDVSAAAAVAAQITFNAATATLSHDGPTDPAVGNIVIPCTLSNATTLTLDGTGFNQQATRGLSNITVTPATLTAKYTLPATPPLPGQTVQGKLTCANAGPGPDALGVTCDPSGVTGGTVSNIQCTPAVPVSVLHDGESIVCTFDLTALPTGPVDIQLTGRARATGLDANATTNSGMTDFARLITPSNATASVPTLGEWALALLALVVAGLAYRQRGRV
jgi:hypothetical protein